MDTLPSMRCIRALVAVTDRGSVVQAAESLSLSQPAISRAIRDLETFYGLPLFERHHGGMLATAAGELVVHRCRRALQQLTCAEDQLAALEPAGHFQRLPQRLSSRNLSVLVTLAATHHEVRAAQALGLTQPTVSANLRDIEGKLATPLFLRTLRGLVVTVCGTLLVRHVKVALRELALIQDDLDAWQGRIRGRVVIGALPLTSSVLVPRAVEALLQALPGLHVTIQEGTYDALFESLRGGDIDILIGVLRRLDDRGMVQERLFLDRLRAVVRHDHPLAQATGLTLADLLDAAWIAPPHGTPARHSFDQQFLAQDLTPPTPAIEAGNLGVIRALLLGSDRLALASPYQVHFDVSHGLLGYLPLVLQGPARPIGLTMREDSAPTRGIAALCQQLREVGRQLST